MTIHLELRPLDGRPLASNVAGQAIAVARQVIEASGLGVWEVGTAGWEVECLDDMQAQQVDYPPDLNARLAVLDAANKVASEVCGFQVEVYAVRPA